MGKATQSHPTHVSGHTHVERHQRVDAFLRRDVARVVAVEGAEGGADVGKLRAEALLDRLVDQPELIVRDLWAHVHGLAQLGRSLLRRLQRRLLRGLGICDRLGLLLRVALQGALRLILRHRPVREDGG